MFGIYSRLRRLVHHGRRHLANVSPSARHVAAGPQADTTAVEQYWTRHNVTNHSRAPSADESLREFRWRNAQYFGYLELMPVSGADDLGVLDFGCGPGYDLVGFGTASRPKRLLGVDVSQSSLAEAADRLALHGIKAELLQHDVHRAPLELPSGSIDLVHCSGVLHHMPDPRVALSEFRRLLRPGGTAHLMVYNYDSLWTHLYVAYQRQIVDRIDSNLDLETAFAHSTDGPDCPISRCYRRDAFVALVEQEGFKCRHFGVAVSAWEMSLMPKRFEAIMDRHLPEESREFLASLTFDQSGLPHRNGAPAGIDGCYKFTAI